uniref:Uncharacterized protein n=1 Tax=Anguilla anguilla TaxID=7936 RepID=A0A0E9PXF0_ANGAN
MARTAHWRLLFILSSLFLRSSRLVEGEEDRVGL